MILPSNYRVSKLRNIERQSMLEFFRALRSEWMRKGTASADKAMDRRRRL